MGSVNRLILIGRAGTDAELRYKPDGSAQARFTLATTHYKASAGRREEKTDWHEVLVDGELGYARSDPAKRASLLVHKGLEVYVEGRLGYRRAYNHRDAPLKAVVLADRVETLGHAPSTVQLESSA